MKKIELTKGMIAIIDDDDFERVMEHSWCYSGPGYAQSRIDTEGVYMHVFIMGKAPDGYWWDHINRDKMDNRKSNLRAVAPWQNSGNRNKCSSVRTSRYRGVNWHSVRKVWRASCTVGGKQVGGYFDSEEDAARAYDGMAHQAYGEFASLNFEYDSLEDLAIKTSESLSRRRRVGQGRKRRAKE